MPSIRAGQEQTNGTSRGPESTAHTPTDQRRMPTMHRSKVPMPIPPMVKNRRSEAISLIPWSPLSGSNRRPPLYKSGALAN